MGGFLGLRPRAPCRALPDPFPGMDPSPGIRHMVAVEIQRHLFTVEEFARMGEAGIFTRDDRVELIDGEIREMAPIGPPHAGIVDRLAELFISRLAGKASVRIQNPIRLGRHTEPQPDLAVARRRTDYYTHHHPEAGDVLLVVEVAESSLLYDRMEKVPRYAKAGIPETWLVDVVAGTITVYTGPGPEGYRGERILKRGREIASTEVAALRFPVDDVLG